MCQFRGPTRGPTRLTSPMTVRKNMVPKGVMIPGSQYFTTTFRPATKRATDSPSWQRSASAKPSLSAYQLDPSLLHNGFLYDQVIKSL